MGEHAITCTFIVGHDISQYITQMSYTVTASVYRVYGTLKVTTSFPVTIIVPF